MGCEYSIRLKQTESPVTSERLEEILCHIPEYVGKFNRYGNDVFEFRGPLTKELPCPPDVNVSATPHVITLCQSGDYNIAAKVLGTLVMEFVSESQFECIEAFDFELSAAQFQDVTVS